MEQITAKHLPASVARAIENLPVGAITVTTFLAIIKTFGLLIIGLYAVWTTWMFLLLPSPIAVISLSIQFVSLLYFVKNFDRLRLMLQFVIKEDDNRWNGTWEELLGLIPFLGALPLTLLLMWEALNQYSKEEFMAGLEKDARCQLIEIFHQNQVIWNTLATISDTESVAEMVQDIVQTSREELLCHAMQLHKALAQTPIGQVTDLSPEHNELLQAMVNWREELQQTGDISITLS